MVCTSRKQLEVADVRSDVRNRILHICYMYAVSYCSNIDVYVYVVSAHAELENTNASSLTKKIPKLYSKLKPPYVYKYTKSKMK